MGYPPLPSCIDKTWAAKTLLPMLWFVPLLVNYSHCRPGATYKPGCFRDNLTQLPCHNNLPFVKVNQVFYAPFTGREDVYISLRFGISFI